jgi:hypothetical protein
VRLAVIELVPSVEFAYAEALKRGFDDSFDWEFVPLFMEHAIQDDLSLYPDWAERMKAAVAGAVS